MSEHGKHTISSGEFSTFLAGDTKVLRNREGWVGAGQWLLKHSDANM